MNKYILSAESSLHGLILVMLGQLFMAIALVRHDWAIVALTLNGTGMFLMSQGRAAFESNISRPDTNPAENVGEKERS